jgi:CheY-like chemotaxis protein
MSPYAKTVLIVEDDAVAREGLGTILKRSGYLPVAVTDAQEAEHLFRAGLAPDVVLLDMILPKWDGWHFFHKRRKDGRLASCPVIVMTGLGIASEEWARSLGAAALLRKPIDVEALLQTIDQYAKVDGLDDAGA